MTLCSQMRCGPELGRLLWVAADECVQCAWPWLHSGEESPALHLKAQWLGRGGQAADPETPGRAWAPEPRCSVSL